MSQESRNKHRDNLMPSAEQIAEELATICQLSPDKGPAGFGQGGPPRGWAPGRLLVGKR